MATVVKSLVDIYFCQKEFISFDFGTFAIVVYNNEGDKVDLHYLYRGDEYIYFQVYWGERITGTESVQIDGPSFEKIENNFLRKAVKDKTAKNKLDCLKSVFPIHMKDYGCR